MRRPAAILGSFVFLLLAPGIVGGIVPWWISHWQMLPPLLGFSGFRILGALLIAVGLPMLLDSFARFAIQGLGTPAPVLPTRHLVVSGLYRYVRNPMYVGVSATVFGQGLLFGDVRLLIYGFFVWLAFYVFVFGYGRAQIEKDFRGRVFGILRQCAAMDSQAETLDPEMRRPHQAWTDTSSMADANCSQAQAT